MFTANWEQYDRYHVPRLLLWSLTMRPAIVVVNIYFFLTILHAWIGASDKLKWQYLHKCCKSLVVFTILAIVGCCRDDRSYWRLLPYLQVIHCCLHIFCCCNVTYYKFSSVLSFTILEFKWTNRKLLNVFTFSIIILWR